jgi:hypothetical protein
MSDDAPKSDAPDDQAAKNEAAKEKARSEQTEQISRMLRKEIGSAADLLIKVQHDNAGKYAAAMAEAASKLGDAEDHEYWKRISKEVDRKLSEAPASQEVKTE